MKRGYYVTATTHDGTDTRQGVYVGDVFVLGEHHIILLGQLGAYLCQKDAVVVPDANLDTDTFFFCSQVRKLQDLLS